MRIGIVGGTGKQGSGLALRWTRAGHQVAIGSRDPARARAFVEEQARAGHTGLEGGDNAWCAQVAEVIVLAVPYDAHASTVTSIREAASGKLVVDMTVPLKPPKVSRVQLPAGQAAALETQQILGADTRVSAALHHVSATHLADPSHPIDCDVLVVADDLQARTTTLALIADLGLRGLDAGVLANAIALESLTPVLIHLNKTYKSQGAGIRFTNLPAAPPVPK
jgi:NADPH-dependent F420 reductase